MTLAACLAAGCATAAPLDLDKLWDGRDPEASEGRLRNALPHARGDDALILQTQIARSFGLRRDFDRARATLLDIEPQLATAGPEARVRHALEWGRSHASATHRSADINDAAKQEARLAWQRALSLAREHRMDALAIDAIHMFAFIDTAPADQLKHGREALVIAQGSAQPAAQRWEATIHNNVGYALHQLGRYGEALTHFRAAIPLREAQGRAPSLREAWWMVAWTLRALARNDEALTIQQRLEREHEAARTSDAYVFEELELLHRARGDTQAADTYARKLAAVRAGTGTAP